MDGMARSCGVDSPDAEGEPHSHAGILQNAGGSVKPCGADRATSVTADIIGLASLAFLAFRAFPATLLMPRRS